MRLAGRHGEGGRHGDDLGARFAQPLEQRREAQVVADRQAQRADRRVAARPPPRSPACIDRRLPASSRRSAGRRRTDGSCRSARGSRPRSSMTKPRLTSLPPSPVSASDPRWTQMPASRRPRPRTAASTASSSSAPSLASARSRSRSSRPDISGVNSIAAPPAAASLDRGDQPLRRWPPDRCRCAPGRGRCGPRSCGQQLVELALHIQARSDRRSRRHGGRR